MIKNSSLAFNILSLSGGGCFCHGQARVLAECADLIPHFHAICGTSGGAINGIAAAKGGPPLIDLSQFYRRYAKAIFKGYGWRKRVPQFARYPDREFNAILMRCIPGRYTDVKVPVFSVGHDLHAGIPKVWYSHDEEDGDLEAWQVARMSAAAHSYFKPWRGYADGGVYANDPVMCGLAGASYHLGATVENVRIFSIGAGVDSSANRTRLPLTRMGWVPLLLRDTLTNTEAARYQARHLLLNRYQHHPMGDRRGMDMDNPAVVDMIDETWGEHVSAAIRAMREFFS